MQISKEKSIILKFNMGECKMLQSKRLYLKKYVEKEMVYGPLRKFCFEPSLISKQY